ncbi:para-nitrobenzyl esterase [Halopseudomonas sabulinigri]|uniref:Carboxylic ester hydrolase n=2 Tax=Halopseudomonas sabulinigri TaxID=472181 RepID=A0A1H1RQH8_9GAMM|nr:para-nitrobenzyl esterase [Halopseudomonas sabulinigri]
MPMSIATVRSASVLTAALCLTTTLTGCLSGSGSSSDADVDPLLRSTASGELRGVEQNGYRQYLGIPYAAAPVGELRFAAPQEPGRWSGVRDADNYGSDCPQAGVTTDAAEECLYLNVFTPTTAGPHPVMVWFHGGAFIFGSGAGSYVPARLVGEDVVVVTVNYRLGKLGFTAHPGLTAEQSASGSYGIMDQQQALRWVADNIEEFGGNPENVTIFGESAGGLSVLSHLVSPASAGLFQKAIVQSGAYSQTQTAMATAETTGVGFAAALGCSAATSAEEVACMRSRSVAEIMAVPAGSITPTLRPDILPTSVGASLATGEFNDVPVLMGSNTEEWSYFLASRGEANPITAANYQAVIAGTFGGLTPFIVAQYPPTSFADDYAALVTAVGTDGVFACNANVQVDSIAAQGTQPLYVYEFADRDALSPGPVAPSWLTLGATHASEIQYIFGSDEGFTERGASAEQVALANTMTGAWASFAATGNPSGNGLTWVDYGDSTGGMLSFQTPAIEPLARATFRTNHKCGFWAP